jgi:mRNA interferase RelE/StbE
MPPRLRPGRTPSPTATASEQPAAARAEAWLTDPAIDDVARLDGAALVWSLKKILLLETSPLAGEPLLGNLIGYRKLTVGDRDWRIVWRVLSDDRGGVIVEISEVWAIGARSDAEVYTEMATRAAEMPESPPRRSLMNVIDELGRRAKGVQARPPLEARIGPEQWLIDRLVHTAGLDRDTAGAMTSEEAVDAWTEYVTKPR